MGHLAKVEHFIATSALFHEGDEIIITAGQPTSRRGENPGTNLVKIFRK
jgi:hypothetical protein